MAELFGTSLFNDANLVSYYRLEDLTDSKGSNNLTNHGSTPFGAAKYNNGPDFGTPNTTKFLSVASDMGIHGGAITMVGWVQLHNNPTSGNAFIFLIQSEGTNFTQYNIYYENGPPTHLVANRALVGTSNNTASFNVDINDGSFHHIALTYDTVTLLLYLDGAQKANLNTSGSGHGSNPTYFNIGATQQNTVQDTCGIMDDVAVFSRALSAAEITTLFAAPVISGYSTLTTLGVS